MENKALPHIETKATTDKSIDEILRDRICFRIYPPGTILREAAIAKEFGVSRTPVREAILQLKYLGLIETRNGVGNIVKELSLSEACQIYEMRIKIAELIPDLTPKPILDDQILALAKLKAEAHSLCQDKI